MAWKVLGKHKWVHGAVISESCNTDGTQRRFTATILGWPNWKIAVMERTTHENLEFVINRVREIRDRIQERDEAVFHEPNDWVVL
jgi:hypothetical protein